MKRTLLQLLPKLLLILVCGNLAVSSSYSVIALGQLSQTLVPQVAYAQTTRTISDMGFGPSNAQRIEDLIKKIKPNSPLIGHGNEIMQYAQQFNLDPLMIMVMQSESQMCTDGMNTPSASPPNYNCANITWEAAVEMPNYSQWKATEGGSSLGHNWTFIPDMKDGLGFFFNFISFRFKGMTLEQFWNTHNPCSDPATIGNNCGTGAMNATIALIQQYIGPPCTGSDCYTASSEVGGGSGGSSFSMSLTVKPKVNDIYVINEATADVIGPSTAGQGDNGLSDVTPDATGFLKAGQDIMLAYQKCEPPGLTFDQAGLDDCLKTYLSGAGYSSTQVSAFITRRASSLVSHSGPTGSGQCTECLGYIGITAALWGGTADANQTLGTIPTAGAVNDQYGSGFSLAGKQFKPVGHGASVKVVPGDIAVAGSAGCGCDHIAIVYKVLDDTHIDLLESNGGYDCKITNTRGYPVAKDNYTFYRQQ